MKKITLRKIVWKEPYSNRRCKDYYAYDSRLLTGYFGREYRKFDKRLIDSFVFSLLRQLGHLDCLSPPISFRERQAFTMEICMQLSRNLAVYMITPQRYSHKSRNMLASALMLLMQRVFRYRSGHGLPFVSSYTLSKKAFGRVVDFVNDSELLWSLADHWVQRYHKRLEGGYTEPL